MKASKAPSRPTLESLLKCPSGIQGLDEITGGGLPRGRPTLICGGPGSGKTLLAMEFLVRGVLDYQEPGLFVCFEETPLELARNVASLGFDLKTLAARKKLLIDHVFVERSEIEETGEYNLEGLFIRLAEGIRTVGAKRVVLDTIEALFSGFANEAILRAELRRLFRWLKEQEVTAVITAERGETRLTRYGLEEYVADCVIFLDNRVYDQLTTRRLRIVKYRGSLHGGNEYPFIIDEHGFSVAPITSVQLDYEVSSERISSGIPRLDTLLGGEGYYRGSTVLISGTAGAGKTSLAALCAAAACERGERALYFAFEEPPAQVIRNLRSIGLDLERWMKKGLLEFRSHRPTLCGLELHLATMVKAIAASAPQVVVLDPISNFVSVASPQDAKAMLVRLVDFLKSRGITAVLTSLTRGGMPIEATAEGISSLVDNWILLHELETNGERNRALYVLKARGMPHSNQVRECLFSSRGIDLADVYVGPRGVVMGSSRLTQQAQETAAALLGSEDLERKRRERERKREALEARIAALRAEFEVEQEERDLAIAEGERRAEALQAVQTQMGRYRKADPTVRGDGRPKTKQTKRGER
jgi:circadian clock protein KaiC